MSQKFEQEPIWSSIGLHGFRQIGSASSKLQRHAWTLIIACGVLVSILNTHTTFSAFLEKSTATLITIKQKHRLRLPTLFICPKNPDALNQTLVRQDIRDRLGPAGALLSETEIRQLVAYAIAGAGFHNMERTVEKYTEEEFTKFSQLFNQWLGGRNVVTFFRYLFERMGFTCKE
ncbi:Na+ channel, partial [Aphelenchoides avenae]